MVSQGLFIPTLGMNYSLTGNIIFPHWEYSVTLRAPIFSPLFLPSFRFRGRTGEKKDVIREVSQQLQE